MTCCPKKLCGLLVLLVCCFQNGCRKKPDLPDYSKTESLSIDLGEENHEHGLHQAHPDGDGFTSPGAVADQPCRQLASKARGRAYIYFAIDPAFKQTDSMNGKVTVEYCASPVPSMELQYDRDDKAAYAPGPPNQLVQRSREWQSVDFYFRDARFKNSQNSGADFRIATAVPGVCIRRVTLTRLKEVPPAQAAPIRSFIRSTVPPAAASSNCVDLGDFFNASLLQSWVPGGTQEKSLSKLPTGLQTFDGVLFDVRGIVQLSGRMLYQRTRAYPRSVTGIKIGGKVRRLSFLHACGWETRDGTIIGQYIVHGSDESIDTIPIVYGESLRNYWPELNDRSGTNNAAWVGDHEASRAYGMTIRLYASHWTNSVPDIPIETLDYQSMMTDCSPFLIGISIER